MKCTRAGVTSDTLILPVIPLCVEAHVSNTSPSHMHTRHHGKVDYTS